MSGVQKGFVRGPMSKKHRRKISLALMGKERPVGAGRPANTPEVLWSKVDKRGPDECWPWTGFRNEEGYGRTWIDDKGYYAHRVIFNLSVPGLITLKAPRSSDSFGFIRHTCDNPCCCNPKHLTIGTHTDNMRDKVERGRLPDYGADRGPRCKLTMDQAREIRAKRKNGILTKDLVIEYGLSKASIKTLLRGESYRED